MIRSTGATGMRALLDAITDLDMKSKALRLADDYETLADRAKNAPRHQCPD
jgi:hypothetical protein